MMMKKWTTVIVLGSVLLSLIFLEYLVIQHLGGLHAALTGKELWWPGK
jgi:hypothetical protein